jgi:hypothetical protein
MPCRYLFFLVLILVEFLFVSYLQDWADYNCATSGASWNDADIRLQSWCGPASFGIVTPILWFRCMFFSTIFYSLPHSSHSSSVLFSDVDSMTGSIPTEIGYLTNLQQFSYSFDSFHHLFFFLFSFRSNCLWIVLVPAVYLAQFLPNCKVYKLLIYTGKVQGKTSSPHSFCLHIAFSDIVSNHLSGSIPSLAPNYEFLDFDVHDNNLTGTIPTEIGQLTYVVSQFRYVVILINWEWKIFFCFVLFCFVLFIY